jgi:manganese-dependent inorganic pyrophosphatase
VGICQLFTLDIEHLFERKDEILERLASLHESKDHHLTLMMITDIIKEGSYLLYEAQNERLLSLAFGGKMHQGRFVEGVVSRKKQTIPRLLEAFNVLG